MSWFNRDFQLLTQRHDMASFFRRMVNTMERATPRWAFLFFYGTYASFKNIYNLLIGYGFLKSAYQWKSVDKEGEPIPWFSYPSVEYLEGLDLSALTILEYGSGNSTMYWSSRAKSVIAIEDNADWAQRVSAMLKENASVRLILSSADYPTALVEPGAEFDIIIVDGVLRPECAKAAIPMLRKGGFIILDDASDYPQIGEMLRASGLLQVDFSGFNPIAAHTKTTTLFFHREFQPKPRYNNLPHHSVCHPRRTFPLAR